MTFLSAWWALAGLLAVPIVLLYLLKMRRKSQVVSSTLLWRQVLADMRANTPFQKLRRNLLLLLQLLALAVLVAALCRPVIKAAGHAGADVAVVIDASASMQTEDVDGLSRFEFAVTEAEALIDNLRGGDRMMLIIAGPSGAGERTPLTTSKQQLRGVLKRARCFDTTAAVTEALRLANSTLAATAGGEPSAGRIYLLSDGVGVTLPQTPGLTDALRYVRIGATSTNVGITSLNVETGEMGGRKVLVGVSNYGADETDVLVNFYFGRPDNWIDTKRLTVPAGGQGAAVLDRSLPAGRLWVKLESDGDRLPLDNTGYVVLPEPRKLRVRLVSEGNPVLTRYLAAAQGEGLLEAEAIAPDEPLPPAGADVSIFDNVAAPPGAALAGDVLFIHPPGEAGGFRRTGQIATPQVMRARTEADVLRFVNLGDLRLARAGRYVHDGTAVILAAAPEGPLLAYTAQGAARRYLLAFHLADSNWSTDAGFLILLSNILDRARTAHYVGRPQLTCSGSPARLPSGPGPAVVVGPDGTKHETAAGVNEFARTYATGFYTARREDAERAFAVNLLSASESSIAPRSLTGSTGAPIAAADSVVPTNRSLWPWFAAAALLVLMVEWYCYHRRVLQ